MKKFQEIGIFLLYKKAKYCKIIKAELICKKDVGVGLDRPVFRRNY